MVLKLKRKHTLDLQESIDMSNVRLDAAKGIVYGVKICALKSCHGYSYTPDSLKGAAALYEGKAINVDHPQDRTKLGASRSYRDRFGKLWNVEYVEGKGLFGNLHYNKKHEIAPQFEYDVENDPSNLGLSHNASGIASADGQFVESISSVRSVDLVADPATNVSLFEDKGNHMLKLPKKGAKAKSKQRLMAEFLESVSEHDELADLLEAAAAAPDEGGAAPDTPLQAVGKMAAAVIMDESMDVATKRKKMTQLLNLIDDSVADPAAEGAEGEAAEEVPEDAGDEGKPKKTLGKSAPKAKTPATKQLAEGKDDVAQRLAALERKDEVRSLCEDAGFAPSKTQLKSLLLMEDEEEIKELIESWAVKGGKADAGKPGPTGAKPKSKPAETKLLEGKDIKEEDLKALLK